MSQFDFSRPGGIWAPELVPGARDFQWWDSVQSRALNGDLGGTWNPSKPIYIGGAGMVLDAVSQVLGGVTTRTGGRLVSSGVPTCNARARVISVPARACTVRLYLSGAIASQRLDAYLGAPSLAKWGIALRQQPNLLVLDIPRRYLHQGARLVTVALDFSFSGRPAALPASAMQMGVIGHSSAGAAYYTTPVCGGIGTYGMNPWSATAFVTGTYIVPSSQATNRGYYYVAQNNGTGVAEPNPWPTTVGATVSDGAVTWKCVGRSGWLSTYQESVEQYYANGSGQLLAFDTDPSTAAGLNTMDNASHGVSVELGSIDPQMVITGVQLSYGSITSLGFE